MPKLPRWTALEAERALLAAGFELLRLKRQPPHLRKDRQRVTVPFHSGASLHPKIVKQVLEVIDDAGQNTTADRLRLINADGTGSL